MTAVDRELFVDGGVCTAESPFISAREIAQRWSCSASTVHRICQGAGISMARLGGTTGRLVRYNRAEVMRFEGTR